MPQHVYELTFMERYRGTIPLPSSGAFTAAVRLESESYEFVLLRPAKRTQYFVRVQEAHVNSSEISLKLLPESPEEIEFLRSLKTGDGGDFAFAHRDYAAWVAPQAVSETSSGWDVVLKKSQEQGLHYEKRFGEFTGDQVAELRARRILLNEKLGVATPWLFEYRVRNGISLKHENGLEIHESPLLQLYQAFRETPVLFQKFARLVSVLYLKLSYTVEEILQLDLELREEDIPLNLNGGYPHPRYQTLRKGPALKARFKGRRHQYFSIRPATLLEFDGICPLITGNSDKSGTRG